MVRSQQQVQLTVTLDEQNEQTEAANQSQTNQNQQNNYQGGYNWPFGGFYW